MRQGSVGEGALHQQITPYSYVGQNVKAKGIEQITVPAGRFSALKVSAQVDIATVMPNWPRFVMHVVQPVIPRNTIYFQSTPPYRLLKQQGATFVGGPEVTTELVRFYLVAAPPRVARAPSRCRSSTAGRAGCCGFADVCQAIGPRTGKRKVFEFSSGDASDSCCRAAARAYHAYRHLLSGRRATLSCDEPAP